jgi:hypothetical protein
MAAASLETKITESETQTAGTNNNNEPNPKAPKAANEESIIQESNELECHEGEDNCFKCNGSGIIYVSDGIYGHCDDCCGEFFPSNCHQNCQVRLNARNMCK